MDWFLYDNGLRHERVNDAVFRTLISIGVLKYSDNKQIFFDTKNLLIIF